MSLIRWIAAALVLVFTGCNNNDLFPSGKDLRPQVVAGSVGHLPGQKAADFTLAGTDGQQIELADYLAGGSQAADAVVIYFTMWCPTCLGHTDHMYNTVIPTFAGRGTVRYIMVDYVSGSVIQARAAERSNGYGGSDFIVAADTDQTVLSQWHSAMGSVVVLDNEGIVQLNEDYRDGARVMAVLDQLLP